MEIKECAYYLSDSGFLTGHCCMFSTKTKEVTGQYKCEAIPISKCPFKLFQLGEIDKIELNTMLKKILNDKN